jgi:hypothetical protein
MPLTCRQCLRTNPDEATFCHFDGYTLVQREGSGPVRVGQQPFLSPLVMASGRTCRNFDELALACHDNPDEAIDLLRQGFLANFLGNIGRLDLAMAARKAGQAVDARRGLDEFLGRLPGDLLKDPKLIVSPMEVNLGQLRVGEDRHLSVNLSNGGMRLLYGSISSTCDWLFVGEPPGVRQKLFEFDHERTIPLHVRGQNLRASRKPLEGIIRIDSSGGSAALVVRAEVPVQPFPEGVLAGALSPRQVAERAKANPKQAAPYFASGAVARWYRANGWSYPASEPFPSGVAAVQQFFEAHRLSKPPKVDLSTLAVQLHGRAGDRLVFELKAFTKERRYVYAQAVSKDPWLTIGEVRTDGPGATIPLIVPAVPGRAGDTYRTWAMVTTNGNRRFAVAVTLTVTADAAAPTARLTAGQPTVSASAAGVGMVPAVPAAAPAWPAPVAAAITPAPLPLAERHRRRPWLHLLPIGILAVALAVPIVRDLFVKGDALAAALAEADAGLLDERPRIECLFHDREERVMLGEGGVKPPEGAVLQSGTPAFWEPSMRFGLVTTDGARKRLTFEQRGYTNNTVVRLDGSEWIFGEKPFRLVNGSYAGLNLGRWKERDLPLGNDRSGRRRLGRKSVWTYEDERVDVTQVVEIIPGQQSRLLDTCLVRYSIENRDIVPHRVGLRFLLDTFIGTNDGVPFTIPGKDRLCDTMLEFNRPEEVPDFIQALERQSLTDPGTVAQIQLKLGGQIEPPSRVTLGAWPNPQLRDRDSRCLQEKTLWEVPVLTMKSMRPGDSAVAIYWNERELAPGQTRELGFSYGLGSVAGGEGGGQLALTVGGSFVRGGQFTVTALVRDPSPGQTVTLTLPDGFQLQEGSLTQPVPPLPVAATSRASPVTWKVKAGNEGRYSLRVQTNNGLAQSLPLTIRTSRIFD